MMTPERWQRVKEIFDAALERDPAQRVTFLDQACTGDTALRQEVDSLLAMHSSSSNVLDNTVGAMAARLLSEDKSESLVGQTIGAYKVEREIGRGGMGEVYLARDTRLDRPVAIKLLPDSFIHDADRVRRFQQEARAASSLNHPNIVTIHELAESDGLDFIVSEYVEGKTLREMINDGGPKLGQTLDIVIQTASALSAAHLAGVIHRDIKPENIMVRPDGYVKVLDFGLAKLTARGRESDEATQGDGERLGMSTETGVVMGTVKYMSPEQARGLKVDQRTDIFSLGVVLYEAITGHTPFEGETASHTIVAILEREPEPLARYISEAPHALEAIVSRALTKARGGRYQTAQEMLSDLRGLKQRLEFESGPERFMAGSRPITTGGGAAVASTGGASVSTSGAAARTTASVESRVVRRRLVSVSGLVVLLVVIAAISIGLYRWALSSTARPSYTFEKMKMTRLTNVGNAAAIISPDGKYIAYMVTSRAPTDGLWVRQTTTDSAVKLMSVITCWGLDFSKDSNFVYFNFPDKEHPDGVLYKIPVLGGQPKLVLENIGGGVRFSPDGMRMAFKRLNKEMGKHEIIIANADGGEQRRILLANSRNMFWDLDWSPDGKRIAYSVRNDTAEGQITWQVKEISAEGGEERPISPPQKEAITALHWLPDSSGFIITAPDKESGSPQLWHLSYPAGQATRITNDSNSYIRAVITADGEMMFAQCYTGGSNIWIADAEDLDNPRKITPGSGGDDLSWTPDGRILHSEGDSTRSPLWIMNADGTGRERLTNDQSQNRWPVMSPDGRTIIFASTRSGRRQIWRMDSDGRNLKQLTDAPEGCSYPRITPDGQFVLYRTRGNYPRGHILRRIPIDGGESVSVADRVEEFAISPDGKMVAYESFDERKKRYDILIKPMDGGGPVRVLDHSGFQIYQIGQWTKDGLLCFDYDGPQIILIPSNGRPPKRLSDFKVGERLFSFALSADGKRFSLSLGGYTSDTLMITDFKAR